MKRTACCYCRYSSDKQQQQSIDYQLDKIKDFCTKHSITLLHKYIDQATTGTNDNRTDFQKMIEDSQYAQWDYLIVYNLSRLSRNVEDQMFYQKLLRQRGVMIISVEEKFDSSPEGDLFNLITAGIAEYYSKNLAKRSFGGVMQNARKGLAIGGIPPLGYDVGKEKKYVINEKEAEAVRIIFSKYAEGWTYAQINNFLNENGYVSKKGGEFRGHFLDTLSNRKYLGEYIFNRTSKKSSRGSRKYRDKSEDEIVKIEGGMPQIIDEKTYSYVQHRLKYARALHKRPAKLTKYLLSGTLVCGKCGFSYNGGSSFPKRAKKPNFYYRHYRPDKQICKYDDIQAKHLDNWVMKHVIPKLFDYEGLKNLQSIINKQVLEIKNYLKSHIKLLNSELELMEIELKEKTDQIAEVKMTMFIIDEIKDTKKRIRLKNKEIENETKKLKELEKVTLEELKLYLKSRRDQMKRIQTKEDLDNFVRESIGKIELSKETIKLYLSYDRILNKLTGQFILVFEQSKSDVVKIGKELSINNTKNGFDMIADQEDKNEEDYEPN